MLWSLPHQKRHWKVIKWGSQWFWEKTLVHIFAQIHCWRITERLFDVLLIFLYLLDLSRFVSFFPMIVLLDGANQWKDGGNTFIFLEIIGSKLKEKYSIWWKKELSTTFSRTNTSWYPKTCAIEFYVFLTYDFRSFVHEVASEYLTFDYFAC